jgi:uroporphyrinogen decarboxylase
MATMNISHRQRIEACLTAGSLDRVPVILWRHFPVDDQDPLRLAQATIHFQKQFDFDAVKVTPASSFCVKDWGAEDIWRGASEGTREYIKHPIQKAEDWAKLPVLDPTAGWLGKQLVCLKVITAELGKETPIIQTIFNPLTQAKNLASRDKVLMWMRKYPETFKQGLRTITETTIRFIEEAQKTGIDGIFYAVQHAQYGIMSEEEYREFGLKYDLEVLEAAKPFWFNMLHLHGEDIMFDLFVDLPVQAINWHDQETPPSLEEAKGKFKGAVCGGLLRYTAMVLGTPEEIVAQARKAIEATQGERFILGTGCVVPITAPYGNILAARKSVEIT